MGAIAPLPTQGRTKSGFALTANRPQTYASAHVPRATRHLTAPTALAAALALAGCGTEEALERDVQDTRERLEQEGRSAKEQAEDAARQAEREAERRRDGY